MIANGYENYTARLLWPGDVHSGPRAGTAFPVSSRYLLTCWHCVPDTSDITARFPQLRPVPVEIKCRAVWIDSAHDIALLAVIDDSKFLAEFAPLPLANEPKEGDNWTAFGFPHTDSSGDSISGHIKRPEHAIAGGANRLLMHSTQGNGDLEGMSGSAVVVGGRVVGVLVEDRARSSVHAVPIRVAREAIADLANAMKAWGDRCAASVVYAATTHYYNIKRQERSADTSNLFCLILSVENALMRSVKEYIDALPKKLSLEGVDQIVCWSLLGSRELLVQVRAPSLQAKEVLNKIMDDCKGIVKSTAEWIDIFQEYVVATPPSDAGQVDPEPVRVRATPVIKYKISRVIKVFIYLTTRWSVIPQEQERYAKDVRNLAGKFRDIVGIVAFSSDAHHIIVELSLPCGRFDELMTLTAAMEDGFGRDDFVKSTFLAYDVSQLWPVNSAEADDFNVFACGTERMS